MLDCLDFVPMALATVAVGLLIFVRECKAGQFLITLPILSVEAVILVMVRPAWRAVDPEFFAVSVVLSAFAAAVSVLVALGFAAWNAAARIGSEVKVPRSGRLLKLGYCLVVGILWYVFEFFARRP